MAVEKIIERLAGTKNVQAIKSAFEEVAVDIASRHIKPFFDMQDPYRPQIALLAAIRMESGHLELLKISDTTVSTVEGYDVLGTGEHLARSLIDWLYDPMTSTRLMRVVALNIVQQTKRYVSGVGGSTNVVSLTQELQRRSVSVYDDSQFFFGIQNYLTPLLLACIDDTVTDETFTKHQERLIELFRDVRGATKHQRDSEKAFFKQSVSEKSEPTP